MQVHVLCVWANAWSVCDCWALRSMVSLYLYIFSLFNCNTTPHLSMKSKHSFHKHKSPEECCWEYSTISIYLILSPCHFYDYSHWLPIYKSILACRSLLLFVSHPLLHLHLLLYLYRGVHPVLQYPFTIPQYHQSRHLKIPVISSVFFATNYLFLDDAQHGSCCPLPSFFSCSC